MKNTLRNYGIALIAIFFFSNMQSIEAQLINFYAEPVYAQPGYFACTHDTNEPFNVNDDTRVITGTFFTNCSPRTIQELEDRGDDGTVDVVETTTFTYDPTTWRLTVAVEEEDEDGDGMLDEVKKTTYTYAGGRVSMVLDQEDNDPNPPDGIWDSEEKVTYSYTTDGLGRIIEIVAEEDSDNDGVIDEVETWTYTYDGSGNVLTAREEEDSDNDGVIDEVKDYTFTYTGGLLTMIFEEEDQGNNGSIDETETLVYSYTGGVLDMIIENDVPGEVQPLDSDTTSFVYDGVGNLITERNSEFGGGITIDSYTYCLKDCAIAIPTLSQWGIIILSIGFLIFGIAILRKRSFTPKIA